MTYDSDALSDATHIIQLVTKHVPLCGHDDPSWCVEKCAIPQKAITWLREYGNGFELKKKTLFEIETEYIKSVVDESPSLEQATRTLGISRKTLYRRLKRMKERSL